MSRLSGGSGRRRNGPALRRASSGCYWTGCGMRRPGWSRTGWWLARPPGRRRHGRRNLRPRRRWLSSVGPLALRWSTEGCNQVVRRVNHRVRYPSEVPHSFVSDESESRLSGPEMRRDQLVVAGRLEQPVVVGDQYRSDPRLQCAGQVNRVGASARVAGGWSCRARSMMWESIGCRSMRRHASTARLRPASPLAREAARPTSMTVSSLLIARSSWRTKSRSSLLSASGMTSFTTAEESRYATFTGVLPGGLRVRRSRSVVTSPAGASNRSTNSPQRVGDARQPGALRIRRLPGPRA